MESVDLSEEEESLSSSANVDVSDTPTVSEFTLLSDDDDDTSRSVSCVLEVFESWVVESDMGLNLFLH